MVENRAEHHGELGGEAKIFLTSIPELPHHGVKMNGRRKQETEDKSISALARAAGVDRSHVSLILSGKRTPSLPVAYRLSRTMGITMEELYMRVQAAAA